MDKQDDHIKYSHTVPSARNGAMVRACLCKKWGPPSSLEIVDGLPLPSPRKGEVRIRVSACGVNYPDLLIVQVQDTDVVMYLLLVSITS